MMPYSSRSFDLMFNFVPVFILVVFVLVIGIIIFSVIKGIGQWRYNNKQPVLTVLAKVVTKRADISSHNHPAPGNHEMHNSYSDTTYFATFEVESGDRLEFQVDDREYGVLVENDIGKLTFQGTRYLEFRREK